LNTTLIASLYLIILCQTLLWAYRSLILVPVTNQQNEALSNTATQDETLPRKIDRIRHTRSRDLGRSIDKISRGVQQGPWKGGPVWTTRRRSNRDRRKEGDGGPKQKL
ncbi:hypothetical protein T310_6644, partial [Rasamsonia emersonii CBS 393.64]